MWSTGIPTALVLCGILVTTADAQAHSPFEGAGDFYGGLLHPLLIPAEAMAVVAAGLVMGSSGQKHSRAGWPAIALGLATGLLAARIRPASWDPTFVLSCLALIAGATVSAGLRPPAPILVFLALLLGIAVGVDAAPDAAPLPAWLLAATGALIGATLLTAVVIALALHRKTYWQLIAIRIAGSWIAAIAMLHIAWQITQMR